MSHLLDVLSAERQLRPQLIVGPAIDAQVLWSITPPVGARPDMVELEESASLTTSPFAVDEGALAHLLAKSRRFRRADAGVMETAKRFRGRRP